ncbi:syntaxin [Radiomyces spectabilis]|uniref:syntaxin n=1 Tax=Radiomyces spectabilis TaxID=64574 RepID=UPI00221F3BE8|nr:syntaxin [Radiomyces spectabilis]KAI8371488.1 syntaxin [Radiomyces spectabilis]
MSEFIQAIFIRSAETRQQPKPHIVYKIEVHAAVRNWIVWKRYSEFAKLNSQLLTIFPKHPPPMALPRKRYFPSTFSDPEKIEERRRGLEAYLRGILSSRDDRWRQTDIWREFLSIPTGRALDTSTLYTSESWLDEYQEMTNTAREIRSLINRRGTHLARNEISASHNCTVQAKKRLMALSSRLSNLEAGLTALANGSANEGKILSEGELRRRQDMVITLKDEKDMLMKLVSTSRQDHEMMYDTSSVDKKNVGDRRALMGDTAAMNASSRYGSTDPPRQGSSVWQVNGPSKDGVKRSGTITSGRALGAAAARQKALAQETEVTRGMDNEGLVKYQQQLMEDQDQQVEQFSAILARQKQIGYAIGDELETQNQILDELDGDVGRTQTKLKFANKKLGKIK